MGFNLGLLDMVGERAHDYGIRQGANRTHVA
jgi:hypothetical protein